MFILYCIVFVYIVLYCVCLYSVVLCLFIFYCIVFVYILLHCVCLYSIVLCLFIFYCIVFVHIVLCLFILYCIVFVYIVLYYVCLYSIIILQCTVQKNMKNRSCHFYARYSQFCICETNHVFRGIYSCRYSVITVYVTCNVISNVAGFCTFPSALPTLCVLCPGWLVLLFLNFAPFRCAACGSDFQVVPVSPIITGIAFVFMYHLRCISTVKFYIITEILITNKCSPLLHI